MNTRVINLKRDDSEGVYIGRAGHGEDGYFGNPFSLLHYTREEALMAYRVYFYQRIQTDPEFARRIEELRGKTLKCFCKPLPCHGDIIVEYLEGTPALI